MYDALKLTLIRLPKKKNGDRNCGTPWLILDKKIIECKISVPPLHLM